MRSFVLIVIATAALGLASFATAQSAPTVAAPASGSPEETLQRIYQEALARGKAYGNLRSLVTQFPGRLSGSKALDGAVTWAEQALKDVGPDKVYRQDVNVPHWERGTRETVTLIQGGRAEPLAAFALGGSVASPAEGVLAEVVEVQSLDDVVAFGHARIAGKIVFFNRPMNANLVGPNEAYRTAVDQRSRGAGLAGKHGAAGVLVRSMTFALDDHPHTGATTYLPDAPKIPAAALSTLASDKLSQALQAGATRVMMKINSRSLPDAPSHNVIAEIRGRELPDEIILVGGHLDSWDIAPGAHDNGAGVVQSIEVLRIFRALGIQPRRTFRCVLFTNEENGLRGSTAYVNRVKELKEKHLLAIETDNGGFEPRGFNFGSTQGDAHERAAARWRRFFEPYGVHLFVKGSAGADVGPLLVQGITVAGLLPNSQRYFDYHHTTVDSLDKVNPRELHLGAAALASLVWLADTQGL